MQKARHEQSRRTWCTPWAELEALRKLVSPSGDTLATSGQKLEQPAVEALGLSKREQDELIAKLGPAEKPDFELDMTQAKPPTTSPSG
ncbi:MAG: hypothetical protein IT377_06965 [Polyangiaceae bacterium]|nr:hypothetical protein [Polyangiaceae bacterium]